MRLNAEVWGPHYWFFLHTISLNYPHNPNASTKRVYYDLIQNMKLFIPVESIAKDFETLMGLYPVSPYLDSRESFVRWMHFIHNKINEKLEKPKISAHDFYEQYYAHYKPKETQYAEYYRIKQKVVYVLIVAGLAGGIYHLYDK